MIADRTQLTINNKMKTKKKEKERRKKKERNNCFRTYTSITSLCFSSERASERATNCQDRKWPKGGLWNQSLSLVISCRFSSLFSARWIDRWNSDLCYSTERLFSFLPLAWLQFLRPCLLIDLRIVHILDVDIGFPQIIVHFPVQVDGHALRENESVACRHLLCTVVVDEWREGKIVWDQTKDVLYYLVFTKASSWSIRLCNSTFSLFRCNTRSSNSRIFV